MATPAKVLVIGLDGADPTLLLEWSASGELPTLQSLRARGACGRVVSPPGFGDDATWASFFTAVSPARHGRYFWTQARPGEHRPTPFQDGHLQQDPFWVRLSRAHRRVAIIDVPKCPLSRDLNGIQLADWLVHGRDHPQVCSWPPALAAEVLARFGAAPQSLCEKLDLDRTAYQTFRDRLLTGVEMKGQLSAHYLDQGGWDLFLTVFKESHCVGHRCWHLLDRSHPEYDAESAGVLGNPIKEVYTAIDTAVGTLLERVGPETTVIVFSELGMGANYTGEPLLDAMLSRLEATEAPSVARGIAFLKSQWRRTSVSGLRRVMRRVARASRSMREVETRYRKCFVVPHNESSGAIRVNLIGREPSGQIQPGEEYDAFCRALIRDLLDVVDPDSGRPLIKEVLRTDDLYRGEYRDHLPDLLVIWRRDAPISSAWSPKIGEIRRAPVEYRSGNHVPDGFFWAFGPGIEPATLLPPISVMDLAPTIATLLGTPLPHIDGAPVAALCDTAPPS